jgi:threonine synthase
VLSDLIAKEQGIDTLVTASTGNAGSSIAGICAAQGQKAVVLVPAKAPIAKLTQILMYGANIVPIEGTYDQAFNLSVAISDEVGLYNRNTAYNPFTIEGKKTVSLEIYEQFKGSIPDYIYVPVGDGVILSGVYKGFEDLIQLGFLNKMPVIVSVQATKSNNIVRNLKTPKPDFQPATSIADSINVTIPRNYYMAVDYINKYHGMTVEVTDDEILKASLELSKRSGLFAEPAAAATFAGFKKFTSHNKNQGQHLIILTGSGLKDLQSVNSVLPKIQSVPDTISAVKKVLNF